MAINFMNLDDTKKVKNGMINLRNKYSIHLWCGILFELEKGHEVVVWVFLLT